MKLALPIIAYALGIFSGFIFGRLIHRESVLSPNVFVLIIVTGVWAISVLVEIVDPQYKTNPLIHGLMGGIVGFFYTPFGKPDQPKT